MKKRLKMKDLERRTGVGREAIRFYIREGLLPEPERPARNVAWYDESFVERILLVKKLQQERYLPLAVIKGIVGETREPSEAERSTLHELEGKLFPHEGPRAPETLAAAARRLGLRAAELRELADVGLVEITTRDGDQWLEGNSLAVAEEWARLRRAGYTNDLGFTPATMAIYPEFVKWLAREEIRLFTGGVAGRVDPETSRRMAEEGIAAVSRILALLREATLLRMVNEGLPAPAPEKRRRPVRDAG